MKLSSLFLVFSVFVLFHSTSYSKGKIYYCPMHTSYTSTAPGTCPICNMDLVLREKDEANKEEHGEHLKYRNNREKESSISIPHDSIEKFGIKTHSPIEGDFTIEIDAYGSVAYDANLYELLNEYKNITALLSMNDERERFKGLLDGLMLKLKIYGVDKEKADKMISKDFSSFIAASNPHYAFFYIDEKNAELMKLGNIVLIDSTKNSEMQGKIIAVGNVVGDNRKIRIIVEMEDGIELKSNSYLFGKILVNLGKRVLIDENSFIESADGSIVYVEKESGKYEMRKVKTGFSGNNYVEVLSGLKKGEKVASPAFLIDSEARLKGKIGQDVNAIHEH